MRKIEQQMNAAIAASKDWKKDNTEVIYCATDDTSIVKLYGHIIAIIGETWMQIFDGGHQTTTTKSRLNAILRAHGIGSECVFQKYYTWFFRDAEGGTIPFFSGMRLN
jgi:hypothetical protein